MLYKYIRTETWTLKKIEENKLVLVERKILRKVL